ncbi:phosphohydrolase [Spirochaetia bacterium]|nr:phosphohydrolase [Spirochaetia bacterium]
MALENGTADSKELEELETLEELDPSEELSYSTEDSPLEENENDAPEHSSIDLFENSIFPVLRINRDFRIRYANPGSQKLFSMVQQLRRKNFLQTFGQFFDREDIRNIQDTVSGRKPGYFWKGEAQIKNREVITVQAKVYLFPADLTAREPAEFIVMFDDVTAENRELLLSVFSSLLKASKLKDNDTGLHATRVNIYSRALAETLYRRPGYEQVDADFVEDIGLLASMHDVGKIGTPDDILNKQGPLLDWEWQVMKEHTKNGAFIMATYPNPMANEIVLSHHEKWNGAGYPFQLEGDMIPLSARIVAIADVYDALRMKRGYKAPIDHQKTTQTIKDGRGVHFDPDLLDVFTAMSDRFNEIFEKNKD